MERRGVLARLPQHQAGRLLPGEDARLSTSKVMSSVTSKVTNKVAK
jgi:hypothetical protein